MANITKKLNKNTGENIQAVNITSWSAEGATDVILTQANETNYMGGLYNKDASGYFKWRTTGSYPISRLTLVNQANFQKLINDIGTSPYTILIDKTILITSIMVIPENITLEFLPGYFLNINTLITVSIKGHILAGMRQWIFSGLGNPVLPSAVDSSIYWFGGKSDSVQLLDGVIIAGSKVVTSATAMFSSADIGKIMSVIHKDALGIIDYGAGFVIQSVQSATSLTLLAAPNATYTNVELLYATDLLAPYLKMKLAFGGGGHVHFPRGTYYLSTGVNRQPAYLSITGEGENTTTISFIPTGTGQSYFDISDGNRSDSSYNRADINTIFTYQTSTRKNDGYIDLKDATWGEKFKAGDVILVCGGASYYDQYYGEQNEITRVEGGRLYLKFSLVREYSVEYMQWEGTVTADFIQPEVGQTVTVTGNRFMTLAQGGGPIGTPFSVGDNVYTLQAGSTDTISVLLNVGRGNTPAGTIIPAGTKTSKARILYVQAGRPKFVSISKIRILSAPYNSIRLLRLDNSYGTSLTDCIVEIHRDTHVDANAASFFTDNASNNKFTNVQFVSQYHYSTQISRSATRSWYRNCIFKNTIIDLSEFSISTFFINCTFDYNVRLAQAGDLRGCIIIGNSTSNSIIEGGIINVGTESTLANAQALFNAGEIQRQPTSDVEVYSVNNVIIKLGNNVSTCRFNSGKGITKFTNNKIFGNLDTFGSFGSANNDQQPYGLYSEIMNNTFVGGFISTNITSPFISLGGNIRFENNYFEYRNTLGIPVTSLTKAILRISVLPDYFDSETIFRNNVFKGFPLTQNWLVLDTGVTIDRRFVIEGNKFINNQVNKSLNQVKSNFVFSLRSTDGDHKGSSTTFMGKKNAQTDLKLYTEIIESVAGTLSDLNIKVAKYVIDALYANDLIDKVRYLNIHQGDAIAALVPLYGWELGDNRYDIRTGKWAEMEGGMISADYDDIYGWKGNTTGKRLNLVSSVDIDFTDACLFVQIAKAETKTFAYPFISGGTEFAIRVSSNTLVGIGSSPIKTSYVKSIGFILSSKRGTTDQYNLLDTLANPTISNTTKLNIPQNLTPGVTNTRQKIVTHADNFLSTSTTDVAIIATGIFTFLNAGEALVLRDIIRIASEMLGRPVQGPSAQVSAGILPRTALSVTKSGIFNTLDNGSSTVIIPHGLGVFPTYWDIRGKNANAKNLSFSSEVADSTNIVITLGYTNNDNASLEYLWEARS